MKGIYEKMETDWKIYSLMSGIALIEEMSKPTLRIQNNQFHTIRLKMKNKDSIDRWWKITKSWEDKINIHLLGKEFRNGPKVEKGSNQWYFNLSPLWLYEIIKTTGKLPSTYAWNTCKKRLLALTKSNSGSIYVLEKDEIKNIIKQTSLFSELIRNRFLAAGSFIVSFDLEFRGINTGRPSLCMTTRYEDFLKFMLKLSETWGWNTGKNLSYVDIEHSLKRNIKATPKKEFRLKSKSLNDIYKLAGPLLDLEKNNFLKFHIERMNNNKSSNRVRDIGITKNMILESLKSNSPQKSTALMLQTKVGIDVVLEHLQKLEKEGFIQRERNGKYYLWSYIGETKCH